MQTFSPAELKIYYPQWVPTGVDAKGNPTGVTVQNPDDHETRFPDHYEQWLAKLNPPPKSEEELNGAVLAEREACIKFVQSYPTGQLLAREIAKELRKSRSMGTSASVPVGSLQKKSKPATTVEPSIAQPQVDVDEPEPAAVK